MSRVFRWILAGGWAYIIWMLTTTPQIVVLEQHWLNEFVMMAGHFFFFGVQAVLLCYSVSKKTFHLSPFTSSLIITSLYGLLIELVQRTVPGRSADPLDWILDTLGAIAFLYVFKKIEL